MTDVEISVPSGFNYGRRIPSNNTELSSVDKPEMVIEESSTPLSAIPQKQVKEKLLDKPVISRELFTEINLFIPQVVGFVFSLLLGIVVIVITRITSIGLVENLKPQVSQAVYDQLASNMNSFNMFLTIGVAVPILIYFGFLAVKFLLMMPRKDRNIVARVFNSRAILFSIEKLKPKMLFNPKDKKTEVTVDNPSKHYDYLNGRPVVVLRQEDRSNVSLVSEVIDTSGKGRDTDSMTANALHVGYEIARDALAKKEDYTKVMLVLLIIILAACALTYFSVGGIPGAVIAALQKAGIIAAAGA